jgi:hypothetical protein
VLGAVVFTAGLPTEPSPDAIVSEALVDDQQFDQVDTTALDKLKLSKKPLYKGIRYPYSGPKATNAAAPLSVKFYAGFDVVESAPEGGFRWNLGGDAQAVHGFEHSRTGQLISAGISDLQAKTGRSGFVVAGNARRPEMDWYWNSNVKNVDEGVVATAEMHGGDILAAGFYKTLPKGRYQRYLVRLRIPRKKKVCRNMSAKQVRRHTFGKVKDCSQMVTWNCLRHLGHGALARRLCPESGENGCGKCPTPEPKPPKPQAKLVWAVAFDTDAKVGDRPATHATFEAISPDGKGGVFLGGVHNNKYGTEFKFKSAGNVPNGEAFAWHIPREALHKKGGPTTKDVAWSWSSSKWTSVKAIRIGDKRRNAIALVHREVTRWDKKTKSEVAQKEAGLALLKRNSGKPIWGPKVYRDQTEGTDVAVAPNGSGYIVSGHGDNGKPRWGLFGRITRVTAKGEYLWTQTVNSHPEVDVIFNECWGIQATKVKGKLSWILSCGTGIEGMHVCHGFKKTDKRRKWCEAGTPSAYGGIPRLPSVWANMVPTFEDSTVKGKPGKLINSLVNSFAKKPSSAAEFISPCRKKFGGGFYVTTDEGFGAGLLRMA